jgi:hypothetical protein
MAASATLHCLTGCAIGEVGGMMLSAAYGFSNLTTIIVSVALAFVFGYALSLWSLIRAGVPVPKALPIVLAADTLSILTMEIVDNTFIAAIPGALDAHLTDFLFWWTLALSLLMAFLVAFPVNRYLLVKGKGHALMHEFHTQSPHQHNDHK